MWQRSMKKLTIEQEKEFIPTATPRELLNRVQKQRLSPLGERLLIKRGISDISLLYIKLYGLRTGAMIDVFKGNDSDLTNALLETNDPTTMKLYLTHGHYASVRKYVKMHEEAPFPERDILWQKDPEKIMNYLKHHRLSAFGKLEVIMRGNAKMIMLMLGKGGVNEREKLALLKYGSYEAVTFLIGSQTNPKEAEKLRQMRLIRFGTRRQIDNFTKHRRFVQDAESFFLEFGEFKALVGYIMHYQIKNGQDILLKRNERCEILNYLSKHWLCEESEKLLLKRGNHVEIKAYIKSHYFQPEQEVKFIQRGKHREIMLYISEHSLSDQAQLELFYRRNQEEILYYLSHYPLADIAVEALNKCGSDEAIDLYMQDPLSAMKDNVYCIPQKKSQTGTKPKVRYKGTEMLSYAVY